MPAKTEVRYHVSGSADALSRFAADHLLAQVEAAVAARGWARIAVSGGSTPKRTFELLANPDEPYAARFPWDKLDLFFVDERTVPPDHNESNYRMTREALLSKVPLPASQVFRIEGELPPEEAAAKYESAIRNRFRLEGAQAPVFDSISLGMGDDGHTASLFPHTKGLYELGRVAIANQVPQKDTWRVTLTLPVLLEARDVFFLIQGADKAPVLKNVLQGPFDPDTLPSQLIRPRNGSLLLLLDQTAAADLAPVDASGWGRLEIER